MECLPHVDVLDIDTHRLRPDLVALRAKLRIKSIGTLHKLRNRILNDDLERDINAHLADPRWEVEVSKSHFMEMYDASLRALDRLTCHQRERLSTIKGSDMVHLFAPAGAGKTFVAVERVIDALNPGADEPTPRVLYVAATVELIYYFVQWLAVRTVSQKKDLELLSALVMLFKPYKSLLRLRMPVLQDGRIEFEAVVMTHDKNDKFDLLVIDESHNMYRDGVDRGILDDLHCSKRLLLSDNGQSSAVTATFPEMEEVQLTEVVRSTKQIVLGAASFQVNAEAAVPAGTHGPPVKSYIFQASRVEDERMQHYARRVMDAILHVDNVYSGVSLHKRLALFVPDGQFLTELKKALSLLLREGLPHRKLRFVKHEESLRSLPEWLRSADRPSAGEQQKHRQEEIILDTIDRVDGLEHLIVICVGLDAPIQGEARDLVTRADLYKGLTRAQLLAVVVNEEIENGWFEFLSNVRYHYKDNRPSEEEAASKHQSHAAAKVWQAAAADAKQQQQQQQPARQEAASEKPQQRKPTPSRPERTQITKKVPEAWEVPQQVSNVWDTRSNEVSGPKKPAFDPLRAARVQAEADRFRRDYVEKLRGADVEAQEQAARKLANELLGSDSDNKASIAAAGAIPPLVELLRSRTPEVQAAAEEALWLLAFNTDNQALIAKAGGIPPLVELLSSSNSAVQQEAVGALRQLALSADNKALIAEAGGIPPLVSCLKSTSIWAQHCAAEALGNLMADWIVVVDREFIPMPEATDIAEANRASIAAAGAIPPLVELLSSTTPHVQAAAAWALRNLALSADNKALIAENVAAIVEAEAVSRLVKLMGDRGTDKAQEAAAELLLELCAHPQGLSEAKASGALGAAARLETSGTPAAERAARRLAALLRPGR